MATCNSESQAQMVHLGAETPSCSSLPKRNSIFSLTFEEIQHKNGKNFGSMNMNEFLSNLWSTVEESHPICNDVTEQEERTLARQGSLSIPATLCRKTVDQVWLEIQKERQDMLGQSNSNRSKDNSCEIERQQTFGEITLEDFLIKAGIFQEPLKGTLFRNSHDYSVHINGVGMGKGMSVGFSSHINPRGYMTGYPIVENGKDIMGESSKNEKINHLSGDFDGFKIKRHIIDGPPEVLLERRQRRMIKNRESAARSRARRQAYTVELELELNQLTEENLKLKRIVEENEKRQKQEVMKRKKQVVTQKKLEKYRRIRRIVSMTW